MDHQLESLALIAAQRQRDFIEAAEKMRLIGDTRRRRPGAVARLVTRLRRHDTAAVAPTVTMRSDERRSDGHEEPLGDREAA